MSLTPEQILASHKANLETLFGLTNKAFEGVEKLVELNVTASRAALAEAASHTQAVLSINSDPFSKRPDRTEPGCSSSSISDQRRLHSERGNRRRGSLASGLSEPR